MKFTAERLFEIAEGHNSLSALGAFLPDGVHDWTCTDDGSGHNSLSALGAFLPGIYPAQSVHHQRQVTIAFRR